MQVARLDPALGVKIRATRALRYTSGATSDDDRPAHVRAASGLAFVGGRLVVIQDDTAFIATVAGDEVSAISLPRGAGGRRRFEVALGNKHEKLDLEACVAVGGALWAFGSGSTEARERVVICDHETRVIDASPLYARMRAELGGVLNVEGAAVVRDELWLFHRGNTGPSDPGPAIIRFELAAVASWFDRVGVLPKVRDTDAYDLGAIDGIRLGFTDAVAIDNRVYYLAAAEASVDAIEDGRVLGSQLGVIDGAGVRATSLVHDGAALKAEGLTFDPNDPRRAWVAIDPDDVEQPAQLHELELVGPW